MDVVDVETATVLVMKANVEGWNPVKELERLRQQSKSLEEYGIDTYFPRSMIRLAKYVNGDREAR
jgi:hypothetical protein